MSYTLYIPNCELCWIKQSKFEISTVYTISLQRYRDLKIGPILFIFVESNIVLHTDCSATALSLSLAR